MTDFKNDGITLWERTPGSTVPAKPIPDGTPIEGFEVFDDKVVLKLGTGEEITFMLDEAAPTQTLMEEMQAEYHAFSRSDGDLHSEPKHASISEDDQNLHPTKTDQT
jgi:hypothetical protein